MKKFILIVAPLCQITMASAQVNFAGSYSQNFDSLPSTSSTTWTNNTTLAGWYAGTDATPSISTIGINTGSTTTAGLYSFGVTGINPLTDRSLGFAPSNAFSGASGTGRNALALFLTNNSSSALENFVVSYRGEQFRRDFASSQALTFGYAVGTSPNVSASLAASVTSVPGLTFTSPTVGIGSSTLDGNLPTNSTSLSSGLTGLTLQAGETLMLRWIDLNDVSNDHFLAIDDVSVTADAVPEPATMIIFAGATAIAARRRRK